MVLACAVGGKADVIVSGDEDLVTLGVYENVPIMTAAQFLVWLQSARP
jgi:predicted nucleic acid-binding protein